jgi:1-acyl-sn-glycerol-3-phosphate acyltransferase
MAARNVQVNRQRDFYYWRIFATGVSFTLFGLGALILGYLLFPAISLLTGSKELSTRRCRRVVQLGFRAFIWFMNTFGVLTWSVENRGYMRRGGQLIVANHPTLIDIVFLISMVPNATCIVKSGLYSNLFTRGPVRRAGYIPNNEPDQLIEDCAAELKRGASLVVFPEGTRSVETQPLHFKRGAAYLCLATRCEVSLVAITSTPPTLAKHEKWYQVPLSRPHFRLVVSGGRATYHAGEKESAGIGARLLTRQWQRHFNQEITT